MSNPFISHTHDEPDNEADRSAGISAVHAALLGLVVVVASVVGLCAFAFAITSL